MNSGTVLAGNDGCTTMTLGDADDAGDRRDVADEIEIELVVERRVDRVRRTDQQQRVAVGGRAHDRLGADVAAGARPVLDDEWLAEPLRQPLPDQAREDVGRAAGGNGDDRCAPAASDRLAPTRRATRPAARQRPRPDAEIVRRGSFILNPPSAASSFGHLVGAGRPPSAEQFWNGPVLSFEPDARLTDDRNPAVVVGLDDPTEPIRRNLHQLATDSLETLLEIGHGLRDRLLETSDRGRWRTGRGE